MECPKCGEKLYAMAEFCDACGCDLRQHRASATKEAKVYSGSTENSFAYQPVSPLDAGRRKKKKDKKGIIVSLIIIGAMVLVFGLVGGFIYRNVHKTPYEKKVENLIKLMNGDITTYEDCLETLFPEFICEDFDALMKAQCEDDGLDYEEAMREANTSFNTALKDALSENNANYDYSVNFQKERKLGKAELKDISESYTTASQILNTFTTTGESYKAQNKIKTYEAYMKLVEDFTTVEFEEGYELDVEFMITDKKSEEITKEEVTIIVVKVNGEWMIDFMHHLDKLSGLFK